MISMNSIVHCMAIAVCSTVSAMHASAITLEAPVIKLIDGLSIGIDGQRIGFMLQVRREIKQILGIMEVSGKSSARYLYKGQLHGVASLATVEQKAHTENDLTTLQELEPLLMQAKQDFINGVTIFMSTARGTKQQMLMLIEESCQKRKRFDSLLLRWGSASEDAEEQQFQEDVYNFQVFSIFCRDLINFLEDLMRSCPKGYAQFQQLLQNK